MKICEESRLDQEALAPVVLDLETIRRRVAKIKRGWSPETARARAIEGHRRRRELEDMLLMQMCDVEDSEETCDLNEYGFSLVG
ncbi:MAG: hypothetical protein NXI32_28285 [bacterium]|nr:hypothetical protein [bacterium]